MKGIYILCAALLMASSSFIDNVRGPLLPELARVYGLDFSSLSGTLAAGSLASIFFTFFLIPLTQYFEEGKVVVGTICLGIGAALYGFLVHDHASLLVWGTLIGGGVAVMGAVSNLLTVRGTTEKDRSRAFCGLHMMYGLASAASPVVVSLFLRQGWKWNTPILLVIIPLVGALGAGFSVLKEDHRREKTLVKSTPFGSAEILVLLVFGAYVAGEVMCSMWMITYLERGVEISVSEAAPYLTGFFLMMALTRATCFFSLKPALEEAILFGSLLGSIVFFILGRLGHLWAFSMAGILGPFFPLYLSRISRVFHSKSREIMLWVLSVVQLSLCTFHYWMGKMADHFGIVSAYWIPPVLLILTMALCVVYVKLEPKRDSGYH